MSRSASKAADNVYCRARMKAAQFDDRLNSREKAAELCGLSSPQMARYELGMSSIPPESVCLMADLYHDPSLRNFYCKHQCPIGQIDMPAVEFEQLEKITLNVLADFHKMAGMKERLTAIAADGKISNDEIKDFNDILKQLESISTRALELKMWAERELGIKGDQ